MRKLSDFVPILRPIYDWVVKETRFECRPGLREVLEENPRLIVALNHSSPLSWLPASGALAIEALAAGGGERTPMGVMDHSFFSLPVLREIARYFTQSSEPLGFQDIARRFSADSSMDLLLFPEGSNCFFGTPDEVQEFRSPRFVELAILTQTPILIGVHRGSEAWARAVPVSDEIISGLSLLPNFAYQFLERRLKKSRLFSLPLWPAPIQQFEMICELYRFSLEAKDLAEDKGERNTQLKSEAEKIRERMRELLHELDSRAASTAVPADLPESRVQI